MKLLQTQKGDPEFNQATETKFVKIPATAEGLAPATRPSLPHSTGIPAWYALLDKKSR